MPFVGWPLTSSSQIAVWPLLIQLWWAIRERHRARGEAAWPPPNVAWDQGTLGGITDNGDGSYTATVTIGPGGWALGTTCGPKRWVGYVCTACTLRAMPIHYDFVLEGDEKDPWTCVRGRITDHTTGAVGDTATIRIEGAGIANAITAGFIPSLAYLVGKPWYILKATHLLQSDRVPPKPNEQEAWIGTAEAKNAIQDSTKTWAGGAFAGKTLHVGSTDYPITDNDATTLLIDAQTSPLSGAYEIRDGATVLDSGTISACLSAVYQTDDEWPAAGLVDLELLIFSGQLLHRLTITANTAHWALFEFQASKPDGVFSIVAAGAKGMPGRERWQPFRWYGGASDPWWTHRPDDTLSAAARFLANSVVWKEGDPCDPSGAHPCLDFGHGAKDADAQVDIQALCDPGKAGDFASPKLYTTLRALQVELLGLCQSFVPPDDYDGKAAIPMFTPARMFQKLATRSGTATITDLGSGPGFEVDNDLDGVGIYYTVLKDDGDNLASGVATAVGNVVAIDTVTLPADSGKSVIWSPGWPRVYPNRLKYLKPKSIFIPDVGTVDVGGIPQIKVFDPPEVEADPDTGIFDCSGKGTFMHRAASTTLAEYDDTGFLFDGGRAPQPGDLAQFVGDNFADPGLNPSRKYDPDDSEAAVALLPYWDKFFRGKLGTTLYARRLASLSGTATGVTANSFTVASVNWWDDGVSHAAPLRFESGTATGGSATTLADSSKDTAGNLSAVGCWWKAERFLTGDPYVGFVLEVTRTYTGTLSLNDDGTVTASGDHAFDGNDQGMTLTIESSPGWADGTYTVSTVVGGAAKLDRSPAAALGEGETAGNANFSLTTIYKRPITASTQGGGGITLTFDALAGFAVVEGDAWRIREPAYELNKWRDYNVALLDPTTKANYTAAIAYSDDKTIWVTDVKDANGDPAIITPAVGWSITIQDPPYGVYRYTAEEEWVPAKGPDAVRLGVTTPADFHANPAENLPGLNATWGLVRAGDVVTNQLWNLIYEAIRLLRWTRIVNGWTGRTDSSTAEYNDRTPYSPQYGPFSTWSDAVKALQGDWNTPPDDFVMQYAEYSGPPVSYIFGQAAKDHALGNDQGPAIYYIEAAGKAYAYGRLTNVPTYVPSESDWYVRATKPTVLQGTGYVTGLSNDDPRIKYQFKGDMDGLPENVFHLYYSGGASTADTRQTDALGATDGVMNPPDALPPEDPPNADIEAGNIENSTFTVSGYHIADYLAVLKWTMEYV